jgi:hypothetical protein
MRRFWAVVVGALALGTSVVACGGGSADSDTLVLRFAGFNGIGITQADSVRETSADVDVVQSLCGSGDTVEAEPFTQTTINAVFVNEEKADIVLDSYTVDLSSVADLGVRTSTLSVLIPGRRCGNSPTQSCATDDDCAIGGIPGRCQSSETLVSSLLLVDFNEKFVIGNNPEVWGLGSNIAITFYGHDDAAHSFTIPTSYVVTFDNYNNCSAG